jgi:non-ribosomal peptide synthetase component F
LRTIRARVDHQAQQRPDATYLVAPETGRVMSFGELRAASLRLAAYLQGEGIRPGARVALLMHNGYQTCRLFIGAMYGGYCITPLNLLAQPTQLAYVLEHSDAEDRLRRARPGRAPAAGGGRAGEAAAHGGLRGRCGGVPAAAGAAAAMPRLRARKMRR